MRLLSGRLSRWLAVAVMVAVAAPVPVQAGSSRKNVQLSKAVKRIDRFGRQRMRTQRMTKSVCFALVGVDPEAQADAALFAARGFEYDMERFAKKAAKADDQRPEDLQLGPVLSAPIEGSLALTRSVAQLAAGDLNTVAMRLVLERNIPVLASLEKAATRVGQLARAAGADADLVNTLNEAGRQRMITQRIAKNVCFISAGFQLRDSFDVLEKDIAHFDSVLRGLETGDAGAGLREAPTRLIKSHLRKVRKSWDPLRPLLEKILAERAADQQMVVDVGNRTDKIQAAMNKIVVLWVKRAD